MWKRSKEIISNSKFSPPSAPTLTTYTSALTIAESFSSYFTAKIEKTISKIDEAISNVDPPLGHPQNVDGGTSFINLQIRSLPS